MPFTTEFPLTKHPTALWATAHRPRKPSSRWTKGQSCTNFQIGPLKGGSSPDKTKKEPSSSFCLSVTIYFIDVIFLMIPIAGANNSLAERFPELQKPWVYHHALVHCVAQSSDGFVRAHHDFKSADETVFIKGDQVHAHGV